MQDRGRRTEAWYNSWRKQTSKHKERKRVSSVQEYMGLELSTVVAVSLKLPFLFKETNNIRERWGETTESTYI